MAGFGLRPVLGFLVDRWQSPRLAAAAGCVFAAAAALVFLRFPLAGLGCAALGNALFHVGGGGICFRATPGRAAGPGIFAAPGALGLAAGTFMGTGGHFPAWQFAAALLLLALAMAALRPPPMNYEFQRRKIEAAWFEIAILLVFLSVALGSFIGLAMVFPWKSDPRLLAALTAGIVLGRGLGGIIADRLGWMRTAGCALAGALPLLALGSHAPGAAIAGVFLFNTGLASAAAAIANLLPGRPAFAFGVVSLGLILGALPAFGGLGANAWRRRRGDRGRGLAAGGALLRRVAVLFQGSGLNKRPTARVYKHNVTHSSHEKDHSSTYCDDGRCHRLPPAAARRPGRHDRSRVAAADTADAHSNPATVADRPAHPVARATDPNAGPPFAARVRQPCE